MPLLPSTWPAPHDPAAAERLIERFCELGRAEARLAGRAAVRALLAALGGNSPYLSDLAVREAGALRALVAEGPQHVVDDALAALHAVPPQSRREHVAAAMRRAKRVVALATAVADLGGIWRLEQVTAALSDLAEAALTLAAAHLLRVAHDAGELLLPDPDNPGRGGGFTVLGMGKLGARELNYSSDVDLVLLYDPAAPIYTERTEGDAKGGFAARFARGLVSLMEARDADGYVFRTDLRLRPGSGGDAAGRGGDQRHHLLREHGPELGARGDDQGAPGGRGPGVGRGVPRGDPALRVAPRAGFLGGCRHPRDEAADQRTLQTSPAATRGRGAQRIDAAHSAG